MMLGTDDLWLGESALGPSSGEADVVESSQAGLAVASSPFKSQMPNQMPVYCQGLKGAEQSLLESDVNFA